MCPTSRDASHEKPKVIMMEKVERVGERRKDGNTNHQHIPKKYEMLGVKQQTNTKPKNSCF